MPFPKLRAEIESFYSCTCSNHNHSLPNLSSPDKMAEILARVTSQIWKDKGMNPDEVNAELVAEYEKVLWDGVVQGYGFDLDTIDYETPDYNMLQALKDNVSHFSHAKNYHQLRELSDALIDEKGNLRTRAEFMQAAAKINDAYTSRYLATEYELAIAGGQMSGKWVNIKANKGTLPFIEFDAVIDSQTTALCRSLHKIVVPIDHKFVKTYYPPNHFGCRLTVRQRGSDAKVTPNDKLNYPEIPDMFKTNLGEKGFIFPEKHPYFIDLPDSFKK